MLLIPNCPALVLALRNSMSYTVQQGRKEGIFWRIVSSVSHTDLTPHLDASCICHAVSIATTSEAAIIIIIIIFVYCRLTHATEQKILPQQAEISGIIVA